MRSLLGLCLLLLVTTGTPAEAQGARAGRNGYHGAIAYHAVTERFGYSYDFRDARAAKRAALEQCGDAECQVVASFRNACAALYTDGGTTLTATGATRAEAEAKARNRCRRGECRAIAWSCTR